MKMHYQIALAIFMCTTSQLIFASDDKAESGQGTFFLGKLFSKSENFTELKRQRRQLNNDISHNEREIKSLENQAEQLTKDLEDAPSEIRALEDRIRVTEVKIAKTSDTKTDQKKSPQNTTRAKLEELLDEDGLYSASSIDQLRSIKQRLEQRKKDINEKIQKSVQLKDEIKKRRDELEGKQAALVDLEDRISVSLNVGTNQYIYRTLVSAIFAAIVFYLVLQFFKIVQDNEEVKKSIFSGDAGIQFITLFSIVIAVILFGILEILGANELSALLGGLSGYILGKSSPPKI